MAASFLGRLLVKIQGDNSELDKSIDDSQKKTKAFSKASVIAFAAVGVAIIALSKKAVTAFGIQEQAEARLNATIKSTGQAAGLTARQLTDMARELQGVTKFGDEAVIGAESLLLTFKSIGGDIFPRALESILDVSEAMGQGLKESTIQLGKALNDPIQGLTAMRRVGIQFTDAQEDTIKSMVEMNDLAGAQNVILEELESQFGGVARAAADTASGGLTQFNNIAGDLEESLGGLAANGIVPFADALTPMIVTLTTWINRFTQAKLISDDLADGVLNSAAGIEVLNDQLIELDRQRITALTGRGGNLEAIDKEIRMVEGLISAFGIQDQFLIQAAAKRRAEAQATVDEKAAEIQTEKDIALARDKAAKKEADRLRLLAQQSQSIIDVTQAIMDENEALDVLANTAFIFINDYNVQLQERINKENDLLDILAMTPATNEAKEVEIDKVTDYNIQLQERIDKENELLDLQLTGTPLVNELLEAQRESAQQLKIDYEKLATDGLGAFTSAFIIVGREGVTAWDAVKQAGKNAISAILKGLGRQMTIEALRQFAFPFGVGIPSGIRFTAAAAAAFAGAGLVQNLAEGGVIAPATGGVPAVMAEAGVPEMAMPLKSSAINPFADAVANRISTTTNNNTQNFNSMFDLNNDNKSREAARRLFPFFEDERQRRGITI